MTGNIAARSIRRLALQASLARLRWVHLIWGIDGVTRALEDRPGSHVAPILRAYGARVGLSCNFKSGLRIDNAGGDEDATGDFSNLTIGDRCYIGRNVFLDLPDRIILGDEVVISAGVSIITHADCGDRIMRKWYPRQLGSVEIGDGTWVGANATVLHGVQLGRCCVVGAGSVVRDSFPANSVVAGAPARVLKTLPA